VGNDGGAGDIELVEVGSSRIRYVKRGIILRSGGGASLQQELFVVLNAGRSDFSIETLVFVQGKFAGSKVRRYRRSRNRVLKEGRNREFVPFVNNVPEPQKKRTTDLSGTFATLPLRNSPSSRALGVRL
jgi:hypothetical protein